MSLKNLSNKDKIYASVIASCILSMVMYGAWRQTLEKQELRNFQITNGRIVDFRYSNYEYTLEYSYSVENITYSGFVGSDYFKCEDGTPGCLGKTFPVKYAKEDPSISDIDLGSFNSKKHNRISF